MNKTIVSLLVVLLLVQGYSAFQLWKTASFTGGSFVVDYFGVEEAHRLLMLHKLEKKMTAGSTVDTASLRSNTTLSSLQLNR